MSVSAPALIPLSRGGTGARSASEARAALGLSAAAVLELASQAEAEAGTLNTRLMTPLRVAEAIAALAGGGIYTQVATEAELIAALAANTPLIYVTASITATQDYLVNDDCEVRQGTGVLLDMGGSYGFVVGSGLYFDLTGNGVAQSRVNWNTSGVAHDLVQLDAGAQCRFKELAIVESNTSANAGLIATNLRSSELRNVQLTFADNNVQRVPANGSASVRVVWNDVELVGGGSSCAYKTSSGNSHLGLYENVLVTGTWQNVNNFLDIGGGNNSILRGLTVRLTNTPTSTNHLLVSAKSIASVDSALCSIQFGTSNCVASNLVTSVILRPSAGSSVTNFSCGVLTTTGMTIYGRLTMGYVSSAVTLDSGNDAVLFSDIHFLGGATVPSGCEDASFTNCIFGNPLSAGGATTLTIQAGALRTRYVACSSDVAISDAGTGSQFAANAVF
ncbi:MAG: hypothetical protein AB7G54_00575 [Methyloceanibacter sp.]